MRARKKESRQGSAEEVLLLPIEDADHSVFRAAQGRPHSAANEDCRIFFASRGG